MEPETANLEGILPIALTSIGWAVAVALAVWSNRKTDKRASADMQEKRFERIEDKMEKGFAEMRGNFAEMRGEFKVIHGIDKRLSVVEDRSGVAFPRPETPDPDEAVTL